MNKPTPPPEFWKAVWFCLLVTVLVVGTVLLFFG